MDTPLTPTEINQTRHLLQDYDPAQEALDVLHQNQGEFESSFDQLWQAKNGVPTFGEGRSLWQVVKEELRNEICGDEGFRSRIKDYLKKPGDAATLTALIIYVVGLTTLPLDPALAAIVVLYILKVGLNIFCKYTEPVPDDASEAKK